MSDRGQMMREAARTLRAMHHQICFETGDDPQGDTWASLGAHALTANRGLVRLNEATEARAIVAETALAAEREKVARLVEALAWYAETENWQRHPQAPYTPCAAVYDAGKRARAALASVDGAQEGEG